MSAEETETETEPGSELSELGDVGTVEPVPEREGCVRGCLLQNFWRYCASGFVQNFSQYYYWILIPLVAEDLGASAFELGVIQCLGSLVYALVSLGIGATLVERVRSGVLARIAFVLFLVACGIALTARRVWPLFLAVLVSGTGNAFYWGPVQNAVGREAGADSDTKTARFSVFHALGKSIGYILGGFLKGSVGATASFVADMVFAGTQLVFVPLGDPPAAHRYAGLDEVHAHPTDSNINSDSTGNGVGTSRDSVLHRVAEATPSATPEVPPPVSRSPSPALPRGHQHHGVAAGDSDSRELARNTLFLYLAWIMNFGAYGSMTVISNQYIKLIVQEDIGFGAPTPTGNTTSSSLTSFSSSFSSSSSSLSSGGRASTGRNELFLGAFLCMVYLAQMTMFLVGSTTHVWMYRRAFVYVMEVVGGTCLALISVVRHPVALLFVAFGCGLMAGTGYLSSYTYSFHARGKSGRLVGLQETVLSMSSVVLPPLAGLLVSSFHEVRAPYWMCCALTALVLATQETTYRVFWRRWNRRCEQAAIALTAVSASASASASASVSATPVPATTPSPLVDEP